MAKASEMMRIVQPHLSPYQQCINGNYGYGPLARLAQDEEPGLRGLAYSLVPAQYWNELHHSSSERSRCIDAEQPKPFIHNAISRDKSAHEPIVRRPAHRLVGVLVIGRGELSGRYSLRTLLFSCGHTNHVRLLLRLFPHPR